MSTSKSTTATTATATAATTTTTTRRASKPCGCGCGKPSNGTVGSCTCNNQPANCSDAGLLRPNFSAGQLLTEDDLQQITTYQNAKRRLTNRYVVGTGVVCGMQVVAAGEDAPGNVIVQPGYALDCCGNDIVISCPYTIDINAMIQAAGLNCGDPCSEASGNPGNPDKPRKYCLYVNYTENPSQPVTPYSPTGTITCINTRVQESYGFQLGCPPKPPDSCDDLASKLSGILDNNAETNVFAEDFKCWVALGNHETEAIILAENPKIDPPSPSELHDATIKLGKLISAATPASNKENAFRSGLEDMLNCARTIITYLFVGQPGKEATPEPATPPPPAIPAAIVSPEVPAGASPPATPATVPTPAEPELSPEKLHNQAVSALRDTGEYLRALVSLKFSAETQTQANLLIDEIARWTNPDAEKINRLRKRHDVRFFILPGQKNVPYSFHRYRHVLKELNKQFAWLKPPSGDDFDSENLKYISTNASKARESFAEKVRNCLCDALIPPCPPCDDLRVLLACVEVKCCKVMGICNLVRQVIITPAALGCYWLPIQRIISALCCGQLPCKTDFTNLADLVELYRSASSLITGGKDVHYLPTHSEGTTT